MLQQWRPDPTFYPSPKMAIEAPIEDVAYVAAPRDDGNPDAMCVVDLNKASDTYGQMVHRLELGVRDEIHHFGWNACSAALCPYAPHPYVERRYLVVPALRGSHIYILDVKENPKAPKLIKTLDASEVESRSGYTRPHTVHCGPEGIYVSALASAGSEEGPGGIFLMDHYNFNILGQWEVERGPQSLSYDFWWHLGYDIAVTSEWGTPAMIENGVSLEDLGARKFGHKIHIWDIRHRKNIQTLDLGDDYQMILELRPAHDPTKAYGFVNAVLNMNDLSSSIWTWYKDGDNWDIQKIIDIPAQVPENPDDLPPALKDIGMIPPLVTDHILSLDDRFLYVSCWGTGEMLQYDVSDPFNPKHTGTIEIGGITKSHPHPAAGPVSGGPQMVELSRDGKRLYFTNSLYVAWDNQFYPDGANGWMVKANVNGEDGGLELDPDFFVDFGESRAHQIRLQGGDSSSDTFCYS